VAVEDGDRTLVITAVPDEGAVGDGSVAASAGLPVRLCLATCRLEERHNEAFCWSIETDSGGVHSEYVVGVDTEKELRVWVQTLRRAMPLRFVGGEESAADAADEAREALASSKRRVQGACMGSALVRLPTAEERTQADHLRQTLATETRFYALQADPPQMLMYSDATCSIQSGVMLLDDAVVTDIPNILSARQLDGEEMAAASAGSVSPLWAFVVECDGERWDVAAADALTKREWLRAFRTHVRDACTVKVQRSDAAPSTHSVLACGVVSIRRHYPGELEAPEPTFHECTLASVGKSHHALAYSDLPGIDPINLSAARLTGATAGETTCTVEISFGDQPAFTIATSSRGGAAHSLTFLNVLRAALLKGAEVDAARLSSLVEYSEAKLFYFWSPDEMEWPIFNAARGSEVVEVVKRGQIMPVLKTKGSWSMVAFPAKTTSKGPLGMTTKLEEKTGWIATTNDQEIRIVHSVHAAEAFIKVVANLRKKRGKNVVIGGAKKKSVSLLSAWQERRCFLIVRRPQASKAEDGTPMFRPGSIALSWKGKTPIDINTCKVVVPSADPLAEGAGFDLHTAAKGPDRGRVFTFITALEGTAMSYGFINTLLGCIRMNDVDAKPVLPLIEDSAAVVAAIDALELAAEAQSELSTLLCEALGETAAASTLAEVNANPAAFQADDRALVARVANGIVAMKTCRSDLASKVEDNAAAPVWRVSGRLPLQLRTKSNEWPGQLVDAAVMPRELFVATRVTQPVVYGAHAVTFLCVRDEGWLVDVHPETGEELCVHVDRNLDDTMAEVEALSEQYELFAAAKIAGIRSAIAGHIAKHAVGVVKRVRRRSSAQVDAQVDAKSSRAWCFRPTVAVPRLAIRAAAEGDAEELGAIEGACEFAVHKERDSWVLVEHGGARGWAQFRVGGIEYASRVEGTAGAAKNLFALWTFASGAPETLATVHTLPLAHSRGIGIVMRRTNGGMISAMDVPEYPGWLKVAPGPKHKRVGWVQRSATGERRNGTKWARSVFVRANDDLIIAQGSLRKRRPMDLFTAGGADATGGATTGQKRSRRFSLTGFWQSRDCTLKRDGVLGHLVLEYKEGKEPIALQRAKLMVPSADPIADGRGFDLSVPGVPGTPDRIFTFASFESDPVSKALAHAIVSAVQEEEALAAGGGGKAGDGAAGELSAAAPESADVVTAYGVRMLAEPQLWIFRSGSTSKWPVLASPHASAPCVAFITLGRSSSTRFSVTARKGEWLFHDSPAVGQSGWVAIDGDGLDDQSKIIRDPSGLSTGSVLADTPTVLLAEGRLRKRIQHTEKLAGVELGALAQDALRTHVQRDWRARTCRLILDAQSGDTLFCIKSPGRRGLTATVNLKVANIIVPSTDATAGNVRSFDVVLGSHKTLSFTVISTDAASVALFERVIEAAGVELSQGVGFDSMTIQSGRLRKLTAEKKVGSSDVSAAPAGVNAKAAVKGIKSAFRRARRLSAGLIAGIGGSAALMDQLAGWQSRDCVLRFDEASGDKVLVYTARHDKRPINLSRARIVAPSADPRALGAGFDLIVGEDNDDIGEYRSAAACSRSCARALSRLVHPSERRRPLFPSHVTHEPTCPHSLRQTLQRLRSAVRAATNRTHLWLPCVPRRKRSRMTSAATRTRWRTKRRRSER
jgi:hypothetical protein